MPSKRGRPNKYDPLVLAEQLNEYIDSCDDPLLQEFCLMPDSPSRETLNVLSKNCKDLSDAIRRCMDKQELSIIRKAMSGDANATFAIFRLKQPQHGWTDKQQIDSNINGALEINVNVVEE